MCWASASHDDKSHQRLHGFIQLSRQRQYFYGELSQDTKDPDNNNNELRHWEITCTCKSRLIKLHQTQFSPAKKNLILYTVKICSGHFQSLTRFFLLCSFINKLINPLFKASSARATSKSSCRQKSIISSISSCVITSLVIKVCPLGDLRLQTLRKIVDWLSLYSLNSLRQVNKIPHFLLRFAPKLTVFTCHN